LYLIDRENKRKKSELMFFRFPDSIFVFRNRPCFSRLCLLGCLFCCVLTAILIGTLIATLVLLFKSSIKTTTKSKLMYPLTPLFDLGFFIQSIPEIRNPYCCYREGSSHWTSTSTASTSTNTWYSKNVLWTLLKYFLLEYIVLITCTKYHCTEVQ
jgi:hypothetical protein